MNKSVDLFLPFDGGAQLIARLATVGYVANAGLTLDAADDVKLAVEEALNCLGGERAHICFSASEGRIEITVESEGEARPREGVELEVAKCVLESMVDEVAIGYSGKIESIRMIKRIPGGAR